MKKETNDRSYLERENGVTGSVSTSSLKGCRAGGRREAVFIVYVGPGLLLQHLDFRPQFIQDETILSGK